MKYFRTEKPGIDRQLNAFINLAKTFFSVEIVSIYLLGSYIDDSAINSSDLDIAIIYNGSNDNKINDISCFFSAFSRDLFKKEIDLYLISLDQIFHLDQKQLITREGIINVKIASRLIYGTDIRDRIHMPDLDTYLKITIETPFHFMAKVRVREYILDKKEKLTYPDASDYYYGYLSHAASTHKFVESKPILSLIGWICTALVAIKTGHMIGKKSDVKEAYRLKVNDQWAPFVEQAYQLIRNSLEYKLPENIEDRTKLRELCFELINFENHYLKEYGKFIIGR